MEDDLIASIAGSGDFTNAEDNFNQLKRLFAQPKKKSSKRRCKRTVRGIKIPKIEDQGEASGKEYTVRGVLESNLWARKICRDHRTLAKDYLDVLKNYESVEPQMYKIGRTFDKILGSLKPPLVCKVDLSSPPHSSFESTREIRTSYTTNNDDDDVQNPGGYFSLLDSSSDLIGRVEDDD